MQIIAISGKKGSGKDTIANFIKEKGYSQYRFADPLKAMLVTMLGYTNLTPDLINRMIEGDLKETPINDFSGKSARELMQTLGTEWRDTVDKDMWTKILRVRLNRLQPSDKVIITDMRFPHEAEFVRSMGGKIIKIIRPIGLSEVGESHSSESYIDTIESDIEVHNYGSLLDLRAAAIKALESINADNR